MNTENALNHQKDHLMRIEEGEKNALFDTIAPKEEHGLSLTALIGVLVFGGAFLALLVPKIYLSNNIYYISRKLNALEDRKRLLIEEQQVLKDRLEKEHFKHYIQNNEKVGNIAF
ncbi:hypothetical protein [Helicobacter acinonychis]|uniref:Septum formation initiator n=1 Tax=Helicobacter acinonychis (strain Sheeba) TaxID=382638 RepID=Q17XB9_HELAH|nr:hypothetical protein [Helicobacter acinonychis]CAJ99707.1 conserved hypothetical protein [Helicobacter acinonychis str. Sheeba]STP04268.1 Uncharacterised protein [Helicobacter acinonychis]